MAHLSIQLLGGFRADLVGMPITNFRSDRARALLAFLAAESNRPHSRDSLAGLLWPDSPNRLARTNLRSALANLRKVINDAQVTPPHLLINRETIQFNKESDQWLDISSLISSPVDPRNGTNQVETIEEAITFYKGPFLNGFSVSDSAPFEEWVLLKREQINRRVMLMLSNLATYYEQFGQYEKAQTHAWKLVEIEPWNEEAHQQLMRLLALGGQRSAALSQYEACRKVLAKELGVEPSQETTLLYETIRDEKLDPILATSTLQTQPAQFASAEAGWSLFVGRQAELEKLNDSLEKTLAGKGRVIFVTGCSGSGKTALIDEFIRRAMQAQSDLIPTFGSCTPYTGIGDPYLPFLEILGLLSGDFEAKHSGGVISAQHARRLWALLPTTFRALVEVGPDLLNRMVSEVALVERVRATTHNREAWANNLEALVDNRKVEQEVPDIQQADLFEQFTKVLLALAHQHPLILFIDDLQWADVGSIGLLFHLGRRLAGSRILVVGAYRPEEVSLGRAGERHPLEQVVLQFQRDFDEVPIDLDQSQGRNFVEAVLESEPNALDKTFRETLFHKTTGHPLFTIELLRSVQECGDLIQDEDGRWVETSTLSWNKLPARVEAVIAERIGRLPQNLRRILEVASVEGEEFTAEVVAEVLDVDEGLIVQQLSEQLGRKHRLVAATRAKHLNGRRILRYRFQHHLFQVFLYGTLDNVERVYFHELVGATLERFYQEQPEEIKTILVKLAWHFQEAGNPEKAIHYLRRSGEKAERLSASEEAITHYRNALAVSVKLPETLERDQIELGLIMALGAQLIATRGFSSVEVEQIYMRAQRLCQKLSECLGDAQRAASQLIPVLLGLGAFYGHQAQFQASQEIYDQIFVLARAAQDPEALMMANWGPGYLLVHMGEFSLARSYLERALEAYDPHKHQWMVTVFTLDMGVSCLSWLSWALFFLGYPDQALQRSREAIALARQISHPFSLAVALAVASGLQCSALDAQGTRQLAEEAIEICRQKGFNFWLGVAGTFRGLALAGQGKYNEGIAQMREGERVWRASGATIGFSEYYIDLAEVFGNAGQVEEGLGVLEEVLETINKSGERMYVAELFRIKGDLLLKQSHENQAKAEACYRRAIEAARSQQAKILELRATSSLSRLLLKQGGRDEARELLNNIYSWFTEGWNAADLQTAYNFLQELS